ncbi:helix-turn-helix transcriptional regulator [Colwellia psychrerythraea]|uniref:WYL domain containing protein n=1 Tax=Colwellia psychrerythraea TaxID=28229 RepID=A0A099KT29_COLPS|nr:YafY family protein [Colwellia psychrerythraea]KGJ93929.1 WYL domain containing protein [Colwellia psychrerythraea]
MAQPTNRILAVLELLQNYGRLSGAELSTRLDLDRRTLRRYIVALEEIGIPIMSERGRYGGYSLVPGFKLQPMMFDEDEAMALVLGLLAAKHTGLVHIAPAIASAQAKLERIMPAVLKQKVRAITETVSLDLPLSPAKHPENNHYLYTLSAAISQKQQISMHYCAADKHISERVVDPYGVAFYIGNWYLVGFCQLRQSIRTFRLDRISAIDILAITFEQAEKFDVTEHLRKAIAMLPREFSVEVLLHTDIETAYSYIDKSIGLLVAVVDGVILHHQCSDLAWFARQLAFWPFDFEVNRPSQLRLELKCVAERLVKY